jgi:hypothetical protein
MPTPLPTTKSRRPPARHWKVPKNILNLDTNFTLDAHIKRLASRLKWTMTQALSLARRALKYAILRARAEVEHQPDVWIAKNERIAKSAMQAHVAIDRTIKALSPNVRSADMLTASLLDTRLKKGSKNLRSLREDANSDAHILWRSRDVLKKISEDAKHRQKAIAEVRQNPGDPDKRVFVHTLAEVWCILFGERPPLTPEKNPFLDFVRAAWTDAGQRSGEDFTRALRSARKAITATDFDFLCRDGPDWLSSQDLK